MQERERDKEAKEQRKRDIGRKRDSEGEKERDYLCKLPKIHPIG